MTATKQAYLLLAIVILLAGCATERQRISYQEDPESGTVMPTPDEDGAWERCRRKIAGIVIWSTIREVVSKSDARDARVVNLLFWVLIIAGVGVIVGLACGYLHVAGKIPCPWWDETSAIAGITCAGALFCIIWYDWLKWILTAGVIVYLAYVAIKVWRSHRQTRPKSAAHSPAAADDSVQ